MVTKLPTGRAGPWVSALLSAAVDRVVWGIVLQLAWRPDPVCLCSEPTAPSSLADTGKRRRHADSSMHTNSMDRTGTRCLSLSDRA